jgi:hypothetical protein
MRNKLPEVPEQLDDEKLGLVVGGSDKLWSNVTLGLTPSHNYGLQSGTFGQTPNSAGHPFDFQQANTALQQFNAPTRDALYGNGNDPSATTGTISRPGAQDLTGSSIPWDHGGNVTLEHGDGFAVNTTVSGQHPLEGTISRNLVVDLHDGGGFSALTLGRGSGGAELMTTAGTIAGGALGYLAEGLPGAVAGGFAGGLAAQNAAHAVNPELGHIAFSQLDNALIAHLNGLPSPNLDAPSGRLAELGNAASAAASGLSTWWNNGSTTWGLANNGASVQQQTLNDLAHTLNEQGPVRGFFMESAVTPGVYFMDKAGSHYYELENGHAVEKQVDPFAGVDQAIAHQAELNAAHPTESLFNENQLPALPEQIQGLPPELLPPQNAAPDNHAPDNHGPDDHAPDNHAPDPVPQETVPGLDNHAPDPMSTDPTAGQGDHAPGVTTMEAINPPGYEPPPPSTMEAINPPGYEPPPPTDYHAPDPVAVPTYDPPAAFEAPVFTAPPVIDIPAYTPPPVIDIPVYTPPPVIDIPVYTPPPTFEAPVYTPPPVIDIPVYTPPPTFEAPVYTPPPAYEPPPVYEAPSFDSGFDSGFGGGFDSGFGGGFDGGGGFE